MSLEIKVPVFPESVTDGTLVAWHKQPGESVSRGDVLADVETDKVVFEVPSPIDGVLEEIIEQDGATVVSGQLLARLNNAGDNSGNSSGKEKKVATKPEPKAESKKTMVAAKKINPSALKLMQENGLTEKQITEIGRAHV